MGLSDAGDDGGAAGRASTRRGRAAARHAEKLFRPNGQVYQRPGLTIYLPGNGGLLYAVAMMAAGWDGGPETHAPGFPDDGSWTVRFEGLRKAL